MSLTPLDIHNKKFKRRLGGGYDADEVDEFLDEVIREFENLIRETNLLREQVQAIDGRLQHYRQIEETLNQALLVAQETAEEVKSNARKEAELILAKARGDADQILRQANEEAARASQALEQARRDFQAFKARVRATLRAQLDLLDDRGAEHERPEGSVGRGPTDRGAEHERPEGSVGRGPTDREPGNPDGAA